MSILTAAIQIGTQAFDLKCTIPEITETGEPLLIYLDVSWLLVTLVRIHTNWALDCVS